MTDSQLEEFRYDVATVLLKRMSQGSVWHYAHDKMLQLISDKTEEELCEMAPSEVPKHRKPKDKKAKGF